MTEPIRMCVSCRRRVTKCQLVRLVVDGGTVTVDPRSRRQGRGVYLCDREECFDRALRHDGDALHRGFRLARGQAAVDAAALAAQWRAAASGRQQATATASSANAVRETA